MTWEIRQGDALERLSEMDDQSVQCVVTSPPYWNQRDYGVDGQIGQEPTTHEYINSMIRIFRQVHRVLRDDGTLWLNLGDSYNSSKSLNGMPWRVAVLMMFDGWILRKDIIWSKPNPMPESCCDRCTSSHEYLFHFSKSNTSKLWRHSKTLNWVYVKPTPDYLWINRDTFEEQTTAPNVSKGWKKVNLWRPYNYYYDAESIKTPSLSPITKMPDGWNTGSGAHGNFHPKGREKGKVRSSDKQRGHSRKHAGFNERWDSMTKEEQQSLGANKRSVWTVATQKCEEAHFATFPEKLVEPCILAGCPEGGTVLDPFCGSGTTLLVSEGLGRNSIGIELNPEYIKIAEKRIKQSMPFFGLEHQT